MKKRCVKYIFSVILLFIIGLFPFLIGRVYAEEITEEKILCDATIEENFEDNGILVTLTKEASKDFKEYSPSDFSEIECENVKDLTSAYKELIDKGEYHNDNFRRILKINLSVHDKNNVIESIKKIENRKGVCCAEPNYIDEVCGVEPNDSDYIWQWWAVRAKIDKVWEIETGSSNIKVGVIDSGIDGSHEDLKNRIDRNLSKCFSTDYTNPLEDADGHGTHVAGIIGAEANNSVGVAGVCWNIKLVSLRVARKKGTFKKDWIIDAINYAAQKHISILNYSGGNYIYETNFKKAIQNYPGLFICSSGNDGLDTDAKPHYPSNYDLDNIISVGASGFDNEVAKFNSGSCSNYGKTSVDVFAPGVNIMSTYPTQLYSQGYVRTSGTSMATPIVTGIAALMLSNNPDLTPKEIKNAIISTVDKSDNLSEKCVSGGVINAYNAFVAKHRHKYRYTSINKEYHKCNCIVCDYSCEELHRWENNRTYAINEDMAMPFSLPNYICTKCKYVSMTPIIP